MLVGYTARATAVPSPPRPTSTDEETEALLDVEWAGAIAPNATIDFVACNSTSATTGSAATWTPGTAGIDLAAAYVANYLSSTVAATSLSYGACETEEKSSGAQYYTNVWQQMAAEGITAVVSAGDSGSLGCDYISGTSSYGDHNPSTNALSSTPYNISAGGTDFSDYYQSKGYTTQNAATWWNISNGTGFSSALSYIPEVAWGGLCANPLYVSYLEATGSTTFGTTYTPLAVCNSSAAGPGKNDYVAPSGGGGGVSQFNAIPSWQGGVYGIGNASTSTVYRNEPDLSFFASPGWWKHWLPFCQSDTGYTCTFSNSNTALSLAAGGTSFVAPQIAGLMALVNQKTGSRQGVANYTLYSLAAAQYGTPGNPKPSNLVNCSGSGLGAAVSSSCIFRDIAGDTPSLQGGTIISDNVQACKASDVSNCYSNGQTFGLSTVGKNTSTLAYQTAVGYDLATGLGSANVYNLVMGWNASVSFSSSTSLSANPPTITTAAGTTTLTASVVATGRGGKVAPVGTVSFYVSSTGGKLLGTSNLSSSCSAASGSASCSPATATLAVSASQLTPGTNGIVAAFSGDGANDAPSTSPVANVIVGALPRALTLPLVGIAGTTATINGTVNPNLAATTYWFEYGTREPLAKFAQTSPQTLPATNTEIQVHAQITGLAPHTIYYFRLVAQNSTATSPGEILQFRTGAQNTVSNSAPAGLAEAAEPQTAASSGSSATPSQSAAKNTASTGNTVITQTATLEVTPGHSSPIIVSLTEIPAATPMTPTCAVLPAGATCNYDESTQTMTITPLANTPPGSYAIRVILTPRPRED